MQDNIPVPSPSEDSPNGHVVPSNGETGRSTQEVVLEGFKVALKTTERVAFVFGLGWFVNQYFSSELMEQFITPLVIVLNSISLYLLATRQKSDSK